MTEVESSDRKLSPPEISVCLCTYKRPHLLGKCLKSLLSQETTRTFEVVLVDNDAKGSAAAVAESFMPHFAKRGCQLHYTIEPEQNIALARNRTVSTATGQYLAFLDDDEEASNRWLEYLCETLEDTGSDVVLGPVHYTFVNGFPAWLKNGPIFKEQRESLGLKISGMSGRTSNALVRRSHLRMRHGPFRIELGKSGGEDTELFLWLEKHGARFMWCPDAVVYECLDARRISLTYHVKRAYCSGLLRARVTAEAKGKTRCILYILSGLPLMLMKAMVRLVSYWRNPRLAFVLIIRELSNQMGKCAWLLGLRINQY